MPFDYKDVFVVDKCEDVTLWLRFPLVWLWRTIRSFAYAAVALLRTPAHPRFEIIVPCDGLDHPECVVRRAVLSLALWLGISWWDGS